MISSNYKDVRKVLGIVLVFNVIVFVTKIVLGLAVNSQSIFSDGIHSISDGFNNVVGIIALSFAYQPADDNHPYGHRKIETILSLAIGVVLLMLGYNLFVSNINSFNENSVLELDLYAIIVMLFTLAINIFVTKYELKKGKEYNSSFLISDAKHTLSDIYISLSIIISLVGIYFFNLPAYFDNIMSFFVIIFIFKAGFSIINDNYKILIDHQSVDPTEIKKIVNEFDDVYETHMIKSRGYEYESFVELHVLVDKDMTVLKAHELSHQIEDRINFELKRNINVITHIEPVEHQHKEEYYVK